ncbi:MAG: cytochrome c [Acidobacteriia bacterium]|nr:cytochrome c [Terriglobia bacterium]
MGVRLLLLGIALLAGWTCGDAAWAQAGGQPQGPGPAVQAPAAPAQAKPALHPLFVQWCARCHNVIGVNAVCPDLGTIGARRDEAYIRQSLLDPNAYIVPGYPRDVMPNFTTLLKPEEVDQLVKFLLTLKGQYLDPNKAGKKVQW